MEGEQVGVEKERKGGDKEAEGQRGVLKERTV